MAVEYAAWPERLFVVDQKGEIAYVGGQYPWGVDVARKRKDDKSLEGFLATFLQDEDNYKTSGFKAKIDDLTEDNKPF